MKNILILTVAAVSFLCSCAGDDKFPWKDPDTGLIWSERFTESGDCAECFNWEQAINYCDSMGEGWRLPTINELRTLIIDCPRVEYPKPEGLVNDWCDIVIDDDNFGEMSPGPNWCYGCDLNRPDLFKFDDRIFLWSSTKKPDRYGSYSIWSVLPRPGSPVSRDPDEWALVRCVK